MSFFYKKKALSLLLLKKSKNVNAQKVLGKLFLQNGNLTFIGFNGHIHTKRKNKDNIFGKEITKTIYNLLYTYVYVYLKKEENIFF